MSSHHFVREGQEPALYIHDAIPFHHVAPLLEWAPTVITRSSVLDDVLSWGIKIDVVLRESDFGSIALKTISSQMPVRIIGLGERQLVDTLTTALDLQGQQNVSIVTWHARELIELLNAAAIEYKLTILDPEFRWAAVAGEFSKWLPAQSRLQLYPGDKAYTIRGGFLDRDCLSVVNDGVVEVSSTGIFWVGEVY